MKGRKIRMPKFRLKERASIRGKLFRCTGDNHQLMKYDLEDPVNRFQAISTWLHNDDIMLSTGRVLLFTRWTGKGQIQKIVNEEWEVLFDETVGWLSTLYIKPVEHVSSIDRRRP